MDNLTYSANHQFKKQMKKKYLRKKPTTKSLYNLLLMYGKKGKISEYKENTDIIFDEDSKLCSYSGEVNEDQIPHGYGKLSYNDKSFTGKFYDGLPMDSSAVLETNKYVAIANVIGFLIIEYDYIRYKKN